MSDTAVNAEADPILAVPPTTDLRGLLLSAAVAALAAGVLSGAGSALDATRGEASGFTLATALILLAVAPQVVVLIALVRLADAAGGPASYSLRRSSICVFGSLWLLTALAALTDLFPEPSRLTLFLIILAVGVGLAAFLGYALKAGGLSLLVVPFLLAKYPGGWIVTGKKLDTAVAFAVAAVILLVVSLVGYPIWFAVSLVRSRSRLGPMAGVLGWVVLLNVAAGLGLVGWFVVSLATAPGLGQMDEQAMDALFAPHLQKFAILGTVEAVAASVASAVFFLSVRRRSGVGSVHAEPGAAPDTGRM